MTDVYRSEILAVVMQQIMDEPILPVLFLRTVSYSAHLPLIWFNDHLFLHSGHTSCDDLQITRGLCLDNSAITTHY